MPIKPEGRHRYPARQIWQRIREWILKRVNHPNSLKALYRKCHLQHDALKNHKFTPLTYIIMIYPQ
jgi:hypothetical protein